MPGQNSIVVRKPYVSFTHRHINPELQRLTVAQLRKKACARNLDISRLTHKWEIIHVLVDDSERGAHAHVENVTDTKRHTFFDLPGGVRNTIYSYVLVNDDYAIANYPVKRYPRILAMLFAPQWYYDTAMRTLRNMSWANRHLRKEARAFFFSHNDFIVKGGKISSRADFLDNIGADGRANIATLRLLDSNYWAYNCNFRSMLAECTQLQNLSIILHIGLILTDDTYATLRDLTLAETIDWNENGCQIDVNQFMEFFALLPALKALQIICLVPCWRHVDSSPHRKFGKDMITAIEQAVSKAAGKILEGRDVRIVAGYS
jgi:hypothetical protein